MLEPLESFYSEAFDERKFWLCVKASVVTSLGFLCFFSYLICKIRHDREDTKIQIKEVELKALIGVETPGETPAKEVKEQKPKSACARKFEGNMLMILPIIGSFLTSGGTILAFWCNIYMLKTRILAVSHTNSLKTIPSWVNNCTDDLTTVNFGPVAAEIRANVKHLIIASNMLLIAFSIILVLCCTYLITFIRRWRKAFPPEK